MQISFKVLRVQCQCFIWCKKIRTRDDKQLNDYDQRTQMTLFLLIYFS